MRMDTLRDLYVQEIRDVYDCEQQIIKALPKMIDNCSSDQVRSLFEEHLEVTHTQVDRLERVFEMLGEKPKTRKCHGIRGIIDEAKDTMDENAGQTVMDAALISSAQRVEHYEIAAYGTLCAYAKELGFQDQLQLLHQTLEEEKSTDQRLTEVAESVINVEAVRQAG